MPVISQLDVDEWSAMLTAFRALPRAQRVAATELVVALGKLGPNAGEVLQEQAKRLVMGAEQYKREHGGDFTGDRDWLIEMMQEQLDNGAYAAVALKHLIAERDQRQATAAE